MSESDDRQNKLIPDANSDGRTMLSLMTDISGQDDTAPDSAVATPGITVRGHFSHSNDNPQTALPVTRRKLRTDKRHQRIASRRNISGMGTGTGQGNTSLNTETGVGAETEVSKSEVMRENSLPDTQSTVKTEVFTLSELPSVDTGSPIIGEGDSNAFMPPNDGNKELSHEPTNTGNDSGSLQPDEQRMVTRNLSNSRVPEKDPSDSPVIVRKFNSDNTKVTKEEEKTYPARIRARILEQVTGNVYPASTGEAFQYSFTVSQNPTLHVSMCNSSLFPRPSLLSTLYPSFLLVPIIL